MKTHLIIILALFFALPVGAKAQETDGTRRNVSVKVIDKKKRPVSNIVVRTADDANVGLTDTNGRFVFAGVADSDSVRLILPKYGETTIAVAGLDSILIKLNSARKFSYLDANGMEVLMQKYNTQPNTLLDVEKLMEQYNYTSLADLLRGRVAGLNLNISTSGNVTANIRGERSFLGSNEPLVVVNGMAVGTLNEVNSAINVRDIKTVEVLKNAAEWGSRGANGVILVITK